MLVKASEFLGLVPKGSTYTHGMLLRGVIGLVESGQADIFTPMHVIYLQKPGNEAKTAKPVEIETVDNTSSHNL